MNDLFKEWVIAAFIYLFVLCISFTFPSCILRNVTFHYIFTATIAATVQRIIIIPCNQPIFSLKKIVSTTASRKITDALNWSNNSVEKGLKMVFMKY